jgi:hypothetical protein
MVTLDVPAHNSVDVNISSLRLRGVRLPPQSYEANRHKLYHWLIREEADLHPASCNFRLRRYLRKGGVLRCADGLDPEVRDVPLVW